MNARAILTGSAVVTRGVLGASVIVAREIRRKPPASVVMQNVRITTDGTGPAITVTGARHA